MTEDPRPPARGGARGRTRQVVDAWEALFRAHSVVLRDLEADGAFGALTPREYDLLLHVARGPEEGMRQRDLLRVTMLPQPSVSRTLSRLAERGLLCYEHLAQDRRGRLVVLTEEGRRVQRAAGRRHVTALREAFAGFEPEDLAVVQELAERLVEGREEQDPSH